MSVSKEEQPKADVNLTNHEEPPNFYPIGPKLILITISLMLAVFCLDLDNTVYLTALFFFELGSLICGAAPNSTTFIVGCGIAGLGSAGMFSGALATLAHTVELEKRPVFFSTLGGMYGPASVAGPLLGGAFTDHASWRWCFYVYLPFGGVTAIGLLTLLKLPPKAKTQKTPMDIILHLDPIGTVLFVPAIVCLLLALQ
ncbi:hypothetical protein PENSUB_7759 [Penicillium subrubescens]|uniref:Major facilitator superfamily (MFS) profile domain-containing protein n=1 Tax=Penicillium subrubescens TaxID=1316194 RepID=A0A1Q5TK70_9EURO|nr:hypothetical protein PENSUB_7759 [Penicillium subrubescens]